VSEETLVGQCGHDQPLLFKLHEFEEDLLEHQLEAHLVLVDLGLVQVAIDLVTHHLVLEVLLGAPLVLLKHLVEPGFEGVHTQDGLVADLGHEVGVLQAVPRVRETDPGGVSPEHLDDVLDGVEVALALGHLLVVDQNVAVALVAPGEHVLASPDPDVVLHGHGQVVPDQVLSGTAQVYGLLLLEVSPHSLQLFQLTTALRVQFLRRLGQVEYLVEESVVAMFRTKAQRAQMVALQVRVQLGFHQLVGPLDGGVRKTFDDELFVPGDFGAQALGA